MRLGTSPKVFEEDVHALRVNAIVLYDDARAADDLARVTLLVNLAEASPSSYDEQTKV
jgi:hypothetical protein